jgi:hypothetical protein
MRRALQSLSVLSLLLCVAVCGLWVRSYRADEGGSLSRYRSCNVASRAGRVALWVSTRCEWQYAPNRAGNQLVKETTYAISRRWTGDRRRCPLALAFTLALGGDSFAFARDEVDGSGGTVHMAFDERFSYVYFPHWCLAAALAVPAVAHAIVARRGRAENRNVCQTCGYDLRATPERCPECGAAAEC